MGETDRESERGPEGCYTRFEMPWQAHVLLGKGCNEKAKCKLEIIRSADVAPSHSASLTRCLS